MLLSIIVPVYNMASDNRLEFCLDSLINQTILDYEIIAVDDCSTDESANILKDYEARFPEKFRAVLSDRNRHQGGAKNIGLKLASGKWIGFVDADDWIVPDFYEKLITKADETNADVVGCDYSLVNKHTFEVGDVMANSRKNQTGPMNEETAKSLILDGGSLCVKIFKREIIINNNLFFPEDIFYEDNAMSNSYMLLSSRFEYIEEPLYFYYQHIDSTIHTFSESRCNDRLEASRVMLKEAKRLGFFNKYLAEIEFKFTQLFYINTLFTYMPYVKPLKLAYIKDMTSEMLQYFPNFRSNEYYIQRINPEEKKLINMACKNTFLFVVYYKLLWGYRNARKKLGI